MHWCQPRTSHPPRARAQHAAAVLGSRFIIFGGSQGGTFFGDLASLEVDTRTTRASLHRGGDDYQLPSEVPAGAAVAAGAVVRFADGGAAAPTREGKGKVTFGGSSRAQLALQQAEGAEQAESSSCTALVAAEPAAQLVSNGLRPV